MTKNLQKENLDLISQVMAGHMTEAGRRAWDRLLKQKPAAQGTKKPK